MKTLTKDEEELLKEIECLWKKANALYLKGKFKQESEIRGEICKLAPKNAKARHNYALSLSLDGEFIKAEKQFIIALQLDPEDSRSHNNYANILFFFRKDEDSAFKHYLDSLYYSKDVNDFSRHFHNYCITLSLGSQKNNEEKLVWLIDNVIDKKFGGDFRRKNIDFFKGLVNVYLYINQAKLYWIENKWDYAVKELKKASEKCIVLKLDSFSKGVMNISEDVTLTKEIASAIEKVSIDLDLNIFQQNINDLYEKISKLIALKESMQLLFADGLCFGVVVILDLLNAIKLFSESILSSLEYFKSQEKFIDKISQNILMIHKVTAHNFSYFGRQLSWVLDLLKTIIKRCESELESIASEEMRLKIKEKYWLYFSTSLSNFKIDISQLGKEIPSYRGISFDDPLIAKLYQVEYRDFLPSKVTSGIKMVNHLFNDITGISHFFYENIELISEIHTPCRSESDFKIKIGALAQLFEINLSPLRKIVKNPDKQWKSIKIIETWFMENAIEYDSNMLQVWRYIIDLRNASFPYHPSNGRIIAIVKFFGSYFPINYPKLWYLILDNFLTSIEYFQKLLSNILLQ